MDNQSKTSLNVDTSIKGIILLTLPISIARLIPELNVLFNSIFLGHLGTKELSYAALTGIYYLIFGAIGYGLSNSILSLISKQAGENSRDKIINTIRHGFIIAIILATVGILYTFLFLNGTLTAAGMIEEDVYHVTKFSKIRIFGIIFLLGYQLCNQYLICIQETKWLIIGSVVEAGANIILDILFIFGGLGIEPMGFYGAAYASVIAEILGFATVLAVIVNRKFSIKYDIPDTWKYNANLLKEVFKQAAPMMAQYAISIVAWWFFYLIINRNFPYEDQAASQAMRNLFGLSGVFSWAFGASTNTIVSNLIGQGNYKEIMPSIKRILLISCGGMLVFIIIVNLIPELIFSIYGQKEAFMKSGVGMLRIVTSAMLFLTSGVIWLNSVVATGKTKYVFFTELCSILSYLAFVWLTVEVYHLSSTVAWMSEWVYWTVIFSMSYFYFRRWIRKKLLIIE